MKEIPDFYARRQRWNIKLATDPRAGKQNRMFVALNQKLADRFRPDGKTVKVSLTAIAAELDVARSTAQAAMDMAKRFGYWRVKSGKKGRTPNDYNLNLEYSDNFRSWRDENYSRTEGSVSQSTEGSVTNPEENRKEALRVGAASRSAATREKLAKAGISGIQEIYDLAASYDKEGNAGPATIIKEYRKALAAALAEGVERRAMHERYGKHLAGSWDDPDYSGDYLVRWLQRVAKNPRKTLGLENGKPVTIKRDTEKTRQAESRGPEATTGDAKTRTDRRLRWNDAQVKELLESHGIDAADHRDVDGWHRAMACFAATRDSENCDAELALKRARANMELRAFFAKNDWATVARIVEEHVTALATSAD